FLPAYKKNHERDLWPWPGLSGAMGQWAAAPPDPSPVTSPVVTEKAKRGVSLPVTPGFCGVYLSGFVSSAPRRPFVCQGRLSFAKTSSRRQMTHIGLI